MGRVFDSTTLGFIGAAAVLFVLVWGKNPSLALSACTTGLTLVARYAVVIVASMLTAALAQALIPKQTIAAYLGSASGLRGILLGTVIGGLTPGSPYSAMPLFAGIMRMGAGVPTGVAMVCAWGLWSIGRIPFQAAVMGTKFTLVQVIASFALPVTAGLIAQFLGGIGWFQSISRP